MARPVARDIVSGQMGWDADVQENKTLTFNAPFPIFAYDGDLTALETDWPAADNEACICMAKNSGNWKLAFSDGSAWGWV